MSGRLCRPAPGNRGYGEGAFWGVGGNGYSWASTVSGTDGLYLSFGATWLTPNSASRRACGFQLRCLSE
ncbi:hypothetical protein [uncultured Rikenella sp.]|uniref:hypothetical protein n=1 Tax=uncultured Rikenella sp. TaxID=368003 RepID=UPI0026221738|nr:hypothetical protein [uncultured Rikenella sp.]